MKKMAKIVVVMVLALALTQAAMAAPTQGAAMATEHSQRSVGLFDRFLSILGAIWGSPLGYDADTDGAIWGCGRGTTC